MPEHKPKTAALIAYSEDLLSDEGVRRLEKHLEGCEVCQAELAAMEVYDSMIESVHSSPMPKVDFDSMEMTLAHEAMTLSRELKAQKQRRNWLPYAAIGLAAAGVLAVWAWPREPAPIAESPTPDVVEPTPEPTPAPEPAELSPVITLAAGAPVRIAGDTEVPLSVGDLFPEGSALRVADGEVHVRLSDDTGLTAAANTELTLARAREDEVRLSLETGSVGQQVAALAEGARYLVLAGDYEVEVRGTRFVVTRVEDLVGVDLSEGSVVVRGPEGEVELRAPARWRSSGEAPEGDPTPVAVRELRASDATWTEVRFDHPDVVRWLFDDTALSAHGPVVLRAAPGEYVLQGWDAEGHLLRATLPVGETPVAIEPDALQPEGPRVRPGHLDPEEIQPVLARGSRQLEQCYERALRRGSSVTGRFRLRVTLGVDGSVARARVIGMSGEGAADLSRCIVNYASRWTFPPPGGPLTFEQPLRFAPIQ